jgi:PAS domain S-box-containing protein
MKTRLFRITFAMLPTLGAFILQWMFWPAIQPYVWFLFYPAVFFSSWIGGLTAGLISTSVSLTIVWWFFIPPRYSFALESPMTFFSIGVFIVMGVFFSLSHGRLRKANKQAAEALEAASSANAELQSANEKVTRLYEKTRELDQLKTNFFANISHELRTPLTLILGPVAKRLAAGDLTDAERQELEVVERNARLLYRHVSDMLDVAKLESGRMKMQYALIDLAALTRFVASYFEILADENRIRFSVDAPETLPAQADAEKCERILLNLLSNAFKFTPDGGAVALTLSMEGQHAVIRVQDTGQGVSEDMRETIFEPFRQVEGGADRRFGGTGLGLAIVREFVGLHGGSVEVTSAPGGGGAFTVTVPIMAPKGAEIRAEPSVLDKEISRQSLEELQPRRTSPSCSVSDAGSDLQLVLIVEDNPDMNAFLAEALQKHYRVASAFDGEEGLHKALDLCPDLIVSDIMMPRMSGDQMIRALRSHREMEDVPIIVLTAKADDELRVRLLQEGAQDYIYKPFSLEELLARISRLLAERYRAGEKLRQSELLLKAIMDSTKGIVWVKDLDGRFIIINRYAEEALGLTQERLIGRTVFDLFPRELADKYADNDRIVLSSGKALAFEESASLTDGDHTYLSMKFPLRDVHGRIYALGAICTDITENRKLEDQLRQAQKMEAIGQLAGGIAHDFNNILTAIIGYGNIVLMKMAPDDPQKLNIDQILAAADRAAHLTKDLLLFSRKQISDKQPVDLNEIIKKVEKFLIRVIGEDIEFRSILEDQTIMIFADAHQLEQVLMNLATNARDAMPGRGTFSVAAARINLNEDFAATHGYGHPGPYALITVSDTGRGMNEETRQRIFEPFFTTKEVGKGTGLGLSVVYGIIKEHDGYINVYSEPGKGTTFRIYLPVTASEIWEEGKSYEKEYPAAGTETILIAEDDEAIRDLSKTVFEQFGYTVIEAVDGDDAVRKFADNKDRIHLVLLDLIMPKMNGKEAYDEIRKINPEIKGIFASGYAPDIVRQKVLLEKDLIVVFKPISPIELLKKVREVLDKGSG